SPKNEIQPADAGPTNDGQDVPKSLLALILLAMGFGASSWVMPCVYPMIPITVSFFTKRSEKEHTKPIVDSLVYSLGIMSTYVVFGAIAAIFFGATAGRDFASNPTVNLVLALLFVVIAGNLFGMYEIALPASWVNSLNRQSSKKKGYASSFLMGMVFSLTAFTCTVPFIDLVGKISAGGEWFRPIIGMSVYAAVFALPFFLLALFPATLT
ncbi:MAG: cytochrome c biogenesis protein CcdA, partial [Candidatus Kapaibacterium sp.]